MEHSIKFSVVIPLYNKAGHIAETLTSVISQSFEDFEVCVINDGSTDDGVAQALLVSDPRIRIVNQENGGVSVARNRGVSEALGDYVAFLDADDYWYPTHLEELNRLIETYPGYGVYSVAHEILREGKVYVPLQPSNPSEGPIEDFFSAFSKGLALVNSSTACVSRKLIIELGGFPVNIKKGEDVYLWIKAAMHAGLVYSAKITARYNQDAGFRSNLTLSDEVPYYLIWLDEMRSKSKISLAHDDAARGFIESGIFFNAAGFRLDGNHLAFLNIQNLNASKTFKMRILILMLKFIPVSLLRLARRYRHSRA